MAIDIVYDRPVVRDQSTWSELSLQANDPAEKISGKKYADAGTQSDLVGLGFPQVPTMTAETQAAGQMDNLLRNWNSEQPFSTNQMDEISKFIRDGVYGCKDPCQIQMKLIGIQNTLNGYLKGGETPFRDETLPTPLEVRIRLDSENQIHMVVRNNDVKEGAGFIFPLVKGHGPKYQPY